MDKCGTSWYGPSVAHDRRFAELMTELRNLDEDLRGAVEHGDSRSADQLLAQLAVLERRRNRLVHEIVTPESEAFERMPPLRDQVITVLRLLGRPSSIRVVGDVARARFGEAIQTSRIASLRRDEERSWIKAPGARPTYVVPPLSFDRFAPVRGLLALSAWPLETRIVAPASPRVDMLHALVRLAEELDRDQDAPWTGALERVVWRLASSVPDAVEIGHGLNPRTIAQAARDELALLEPEDSGERRTAAERAVAHLDDQGRLFGTRLRVVAGGLVAAGGAS